MKLKLKNVRITFPHVFVPDTDGKFPSNKYSARLLIDKTSDTAAQIKAAIEEAGKAGFGAKWDAIKASLSDEKRFLHDGDKKADLAGHRGNFYINAKSTVRPQVRDKDTSVLASTDGKIYSGCYVDAQIDLYAATDFKMVAASLLSIQLRADGEPLGGVRAEDDDFEVIQGSDAAELV